MVRIIIAAAIVLSLLLFGTWLTLYMAYGLGERTPPVVRISELSDSLTIDFHDDGSAIIHAAQRSDTYAALGFIHAREHAWTMALWRQTAVGRLSEWYGGQMLALDQVVRRIGLARAARTAYQRLPADERAILDAYARGVNAVWADQQGLRSNEFVLLEHSPEPWEPWHALAIERLIAWLAAARPSTRELASIPPTLIDFVRSDRQLREWLHLHGFEHSVAWALQDSSGTQLVHRQVYGASAVPILHPVQIESDSASFSLTTLIGTPFAPMGRTDAFAWAVLLSSDLSVEPAWRDTSAITWRYDRIRTDEGREQLLRVPADPVEVFFPVVNREDSNGTTRLDTLASADTTSSLIPGWVVNWSGFGALSDAGAWIALAQDRSPSSFQLFRGDGMMLSRDGSVAVMGSPPVDESFARGRLVGISPWSRFVAARIDSLSAPDLGVETIDVLNDMESPWAARLAPTMTHSAIAVPEHAQLVTEALTYLRNWDFAFDRASIAASVFDRWVTVYRDSLGRWPDVQVPDTALAQNLVLYETLVKTVALLAGEYGSDPTTWRWERIQPHRYYFPGWSVDSLVPGPKPSARYAPIELPGMGHPTTSYFGPSRLTESLSSPARWVSWISTSDWETLRFRHRQFPANRFFGRYLVSDRLPEAVTLGDPNRRKQSIQLIPGS